MNWQTRVHICIRIQIKMDIVPVLHHLLPVMKLNGKEHEIVVISNFQHNEIFIGSITGRVGIHNWD